MKILNRWWLVVGLLFFNFCVWSAVVAETPNGQLKVSFLDVGQGDAILIEAPNKNQILIDGGPDGKVLERLGEVLPFFDRSIDLVIATHPDADHIGGLPEVFAKYEIAGYLESGVNSDTALAQALEQAVEAEEAKEILARRGQRAVLDEQAGVYLEILFPNGDVSSWKTNDASIVAKLVYGNTTFLLTGDTPQKIENYLAYQEAENLQSDVLKVSHHGSKSSSSFPFLGFVKPKIAVVSAGKNNRYGHPNQEVLDSLANLKTEILRTDEKGTITVVSDGNDISH